MATYRIYEENMEKLTKKLNRISNKCKKYGCEFHFAEVGEEYKEITDEFGNKLTARFVLVEAEGTAIINGWKFVASLDHTDKGNIINRVDDSIEVPERYYEGKAVCEHCGNKNLKYSYIVMNEKTGDFKQVGRNCLADFTRGLSAEGIAAYLDGIKELENSEAPMGGSTYRYYIPTEEYLHYVAETIRCFGYVKSDDDINKPTRYRAERFWIADHLYNRITQESRMVILKEMKEVGFNANSEKAVQDTQEALKWLLEQKDDNNYIHNLKVACNCEYVSQMGIVASLFPTWNRNLEYEAQKKAEAEKAKVSEYVGEVGQRLTIKVAEMTAITGWETQWGYTTIYKIVDENGNVYTWKTSSYVPDGVKEIKGTVKEHKEYREIKQTELTRCKVVA